MSTKGYIRSTPVTVTLTTGANQATSVASDTGTVVTGIVNGQRVGPTYVPAISPSSFPAQAANRVFAGPGTGAAAAPTFRALIAADLPAGTGTVTSVGLTLPAFLTVAGSPITTSGTLSATLATQTANTFFAGPGSAGPTAPTFRAMVTADLPSGYDASLMHLTGTETATGAKTFSGGITTGTLTITGGAANTRISTSGSTLTFITNNATAFAVTSAQEIALLGSTGAVISRSGVTGGVLFQNAAGTANADGKPLFSMFVDVAGGTATIPLTQSNYVVSSTANATTRTLPSAATCYVGQTLYFVQEGAHVLTITAPSGVTVSMQSAYGTTTTSVTSKTAASWATNGAAGADGTSAQLVCTATNGSTTATWRQVSGIGLWA